MEEPPKKQIEYRRTASGQTAKITDVPRKWNFFGTLLQVIGLLLVVYGVVLLLGLHVQAPK